MTVLRRLRDRLDLSTGQPADQNGQLAPPLCRQPPPHHPLRGRAVHLFAGPPIGPEPAALSVRPEVIRSTRMALQRFQGRGMERLWRSVKYEEVFLKAYATVAEARSGIASYFALYNDERPHQALDYRTPREVFEAGAGLWICCRSLD